MPVSETVPLAGKCPTLIRLDLMSQGWITLRVIPPLELGFWSHPLNVCGLPGRKVKA